MIVGLLLMCTMSQVDGARPPPIAVRLSVDTSKEHVVATLTFRNTSREVTHLLRWMIGLDGHVGADVFELKAEQGKSIQRHVMGKYSDAPEYYVLLRPNEELKTTVKIDVEYDLLRGRHAYQLSYAAYLGMPAKEQLYQVRSNPVSFTFDSLPVRK